MLEEAIGDAPHGGGGLCDLHPGPGEAQGRRGRLKLADDRDGAMLTGVLDVAVAVGLSSREGEEEVSRPH
jgi:hypothetical protein